MTPTAPLYLACSTHDYHPAGDDCPAVVRDGAGVALAYRARFDATTEGRHAARTAR